MKVFKNKYKLLFRFISFIVLLIILMTGIYLLNVYKTNRYYYQKYNVNAPVALRKFPYPYKASLAICSDIDNTETIEEFEEIQTYLNTKEITSMGKGVDLEIGNSFFMYEPQDGAISYFLDKPEVAEMIRKYIKTGYIDCMHSYGKKLDFTRQDAIKCLKELKDHNCKVDVWIDHTVSKDNMGDDVTFGLGDHPDSNAYHADITLQYGIKFVWLGRVTMVIGQVTPIALKNFTSIYDSDHFINSIINMLKEYSKNVLAIFGYKKYEIHKNNDLVKISTLNDGQKIYEFIRFDNYWEGVGSGAQSSRLAYTISKKTLNRLKEDGGYMIVYTHFGKNDDCSQYICAETQDALKNLEKEYERGDIYVTTTSNLLNYYITHKYLNWSYEINSKEVIIYIKNIMDPLFGEVVPEVEDIRGITFYVPGNIDVSVFIKGNIPVKYRENKADYTQKKSITIIK